MSRPFIILLGKDGRLGWELRRTLAPLGNLMALGRDVDVRGSAVLAEITGTVGIDAIVNATAYTDVDGAEQHRDTAFAVNAKAPGMIAREAARGHVLFVHFSTDYVFDGRASRPYTESDEPAPISVYGESKLAGEQAIAAAGGPHLILRTSWLYSMRRPGFVPTVLRHVRQGRPIDIVEDQVGCPTWARTLAEATAQALACLAAGTGFALEPEASGVYHVCADGHASRYELARAIARHDPRTGQRAARLLKPVSGRDFPQPAARPAFSALDSSRFAERFRLRLPHWEEQLVRALEGETSVPDHASNTPAKPSTVRPANAN